MAEVLHVTFLLWILGTSLVQVCSQGPPPCLTGTMTDVQSWVTETGELTITADASSALDLSAHPNPTAALHKTLATKLRARNISVKYLSLARNHLTRIPAIFNELVDKDGWRLSATIQYLTLYGNRFIEISSPGEQFDELFNATGATEIRTGMIRREQNRAMWSTGFQGVVFTKLKELDLRNCAIERLDAKVFANMPQLEALYLSGNSISLISNNAFEGIPKLIHLDLSWNNGFQHHENSKHLTIESDDAFAGLPNLKSLDFSYTTLNPGRTAALRSVGQKLERLSLCSTGPNRLESGFFSNTSLKILDLSGNQMILGTADALSGLEDTLTILYASEIGLTSLDIFANFTKLEILKVNNNDIVSLGSKTAKSLTSLQAVDLRRNRFTNWAKPAFSHMPSLRLLDLRSNTINVINKEMIRDFGNVSFLALSGNPMVCNCPAKEFITLAARNEEYLSKNHLLPLHGNSLEISRNEGGFSFHSGFIDVNNVIASRKNITSRLKSEDRPIKVKVQGNFVLVDYERRAYSCLELPEGRTVPFVEVRSCKERSGLSHKLHKSRKELLVLLIIPGLLLPVLFIAYTYRRNLRYCFIMMRNSAMLGMVNEDKPISDDTIFNYDVFVSYCNEDRPWVLDQLLSHLEKDCSVSLCLHERDFQVGLTILENIVSCMDRSKSIMLVISKQFLKSQWCQFEMHLAQHRLLETRREDLILILLEDIPRRLRPNTLHYLMLTKTYIVWPKTKSEQQVFWKRLKKSVTTQRQREDRVSLA